MDFTRFSPTAICDGVTTDQIRSTARFYVGPLFTFSGADRDRTCFIEKLPQEESVSRTVL